MNQPDPEHHSEIGPSPGTAAAVGRLMALGGTGFLVTSAAGDLMIGAFPRPDASVGGLVLFYAEHHAHW